MLTKTRRTLKFFFIAVVTVAFLTFAVVNRETIHISLFPLPYAADMPLFLFAILTFALGVTTGWFAMGLKLSRSQGMLKAEHKRVMALQNEVGALHSEKQESLPAPLSHA